MTALGQGERLSADDQATAREQEFLAAALRNQEIAARAAPAVRGVCRNCDAQCLPQAVFCDEDCRGDFEQRMARLERQGKVPR